MLILVVMSGWLLVSSLGEHQDGLTKNFLRFFCFWSLFLVSIHPHLRVVNCSGWTCPSFLFFFTAELVLKQIYHFLLLMLTTILTFCQNVSFSLIHRTWVSWGYNLSKGFKLAFKKSSHRWFIFNVVLNIFNICESREKSISNPTYISHI